MGTADAVLTGTQFMEVKFSIYLNRRVFVMGHIHEAHTSRGTERRLDEEQKKKKVHLSRKVRKRTFEHAPSRDSDQPAHRAI